MTGPVCACSHNKLSHEVEEAPACCHDGCGCQRFRPLAPGQRPAPVTSDWHALLHAARETGAPKCVRLADRIEAELEQLRERVATERARARAQAEVERLEKELAEARRQAMAGPARVGGKHQCPDCPESFATSQGRGAHRARKHGYRRGDGAVA